MFCFFLEISNKSERECRVVDIEKQNKDESEKLLMTDLEANGLRVVFPVMNNSSKMGPISQAKGHKWYSSGGKCLEKSNERRCFCSCNV